MLALAAILRSLANMETGLRSTLNLTQSDRCLCVSRCYSHSSTMGLDLHHLCCSSARRGIAGTSGLKVTYAHKANVNVNADDDLMFLKSVSDLACRETFTVQPQDIPSFVPRNSTQAIGRTCAFAALLSRPTSTIWSLSLQHPNCATPACYLSLVWVGLMAMAKTPIKIKKVAMRPFQHTLQPQFQLDVKSHSTLEAVIWCHSQEAINWRDVSLHGQGPRSLLHRVA